MNWRDSEKAVALLKPGTSQYEVATLIYGRDFSWSGPYDSEREARQEADEVNRSQSCRAQVLLIPEGSK